MKKSHSALIILSTVLSLSFTLAGEARLQTSEQDEESEIRESEKCELQYQNLIGKFGKDYSDCYGTIETSECAKKIAEEKSKITNLVLIVDASGSMAAQITGGNKMEVAKKSAREFINSLDLKTNAGLIVYGHRGSSKATDKNTSCAGVEVVQTVKPINVGQLESQINTLKATGWTPIGASLLKAQEILADYPADKYRNIVVLISDGKETCGSDPVQIAEKINLGGTKVITHVIGLDVGGGAEKQLKLLAEKGKGKYYAAHSANELKLAFIKVTSQQICTHKKELARVKSSFSVNTSANTCIFRINTELQGVLMGINMVGPTKEKDAKTGITADCKKYVMDKYDERVESIREQIKESHNQGREKIDSEYN